LLLCLENKIIKCGAEKNGELDMINILEYHGEREREIEKGTLNLKRVSPC